LSILPATGPETLGFIDIGTNSVRLMVARVDPDRTWTTLTLQKEPVRLGEGEFGTTNELRPEAMARAILVCRTFVDLARAHGARDMVAVATAATREARNRSTFLRMLRDDAGLDVHIVSGKEEARLIFLGVLTKVNLEGRRALVIDIGGGSTEIAVGDAGGAQYMDSLRLGGIRLTAEFPETGTGPVSKDVFEAMRRRVQVAIARTRRKVTSSRFDVVYGTSGTIRNLAAMAARSGRNGAERPGLLHRSHLRQIAERLRSGDLAARRAMPGLNPERADIIVAGAAILDALMEELGLAEIQALPECGLREGLVLDHLARTTGTGLERRGTVRERSVLQLAHAAAFDEAHARHVARLAVELFDSGRTSGLHKHGAVERELLHYAALLHDIGTFLNYNDHHVHSHYFIRNADLAGFDQRELDLMAATALFHRKGRPSPRHAALSELDTPSRNMVRVLIGLLRLAEYLDRSHSRAVAHVAFRPNGKRGLTLEVTPAKDWHLELWRLQDRRQAIEEALGRTLRIREATGA
jgi:exopolyphosphatase/guanosine-5'-triphosphate,3'-diphosphate pyrophosphatase